MEPVTRRGRRRSIPETAFATALRLHREGYGYQRIANRLAEIGVSTTRSSVHRLIAGLPPYGARTSR